MDSFSFYFTFIIDNHFIFYIIRTHEKNVIFFLFVAVCCRFDIM